MYDRLLISSFLEKMTTLWLAWMEWVRFRRFYVTSLPSPASPRVVLFISLNLKLCNPLCRGKLSSQNQNARPSEQGGELNQPRTLTFIGPKLQESRIVIATKRTFISFPVFAFTSQDPVEANTVRVLLISSPLCRSWMIQNKKSWSLSLYLYCCTLSILWIIIVVGNACPYFHRMVG